MVGSDIRGVCDNPPTRNGGAMDGTIEDRLGAAGRQSRESEQ